MKKNEMFISLALLPVFLATLIVAGVAVVRFGFRSINQAFDSLEPQTGIVLGVSAIVALLCSALIGRAIRSAKQREIESHLHSERAAIFQALMESLGLLGSEGSNGMGDLFAVEKASLLRGSVAVNNEYRALLRLLSDRGADEKILRSQITKFLLALRRDCGQSTYGLESEDWSDLVRFPSRQVAPERNGDSVPPHFTGVDVAPPTHRLSPRR